MRTSTKILSFALAVLVISLTVYDTQLKAAYLKDDFRKPFGGYTVHNNTGFNSIELHSGTAINVEVVKGPYKILVDPGASDFVKIRQLGKKLVIDAEFKDHYRSRPVDYIIFISCPDLSAFSSDAYYTVNGRSWTDTLPNIFEKKPTLISGFTADSLTLTENNGSNVRLENDHISLLKAVTGTGNKSGSILTIGLGNSFKTTDLRILNKSTFNIEHSAGAQIQYEIADSAKLNVNGAVIKQMFKIKQP